MLAAPAASSAATPDGAAAPTTTCRIRRVPGRRPRRPPRRLSRRPCGPRRRCRSPVPDEKLHALPRPGRRPRSRARPRAPPPAGRAPSRRPTPSRRPRRGRRPARGTDASRWAARRGAGVRAPRATTTWRLRLRRFVSAAGRASADGLVRCPGGGGDRACRHVRGSSGPWWRWRRQPDFGVRAGLMLLPLGIVNQLHAPATLPDRRPAADGPAHHSRPIWRELGRGDLRRRGGRAHLPGRRDDAASTPTACTAQAPLAGARGNGRESAHDVAALGRGSSYSGCRRFVVGAAATTARLRGGRPELDGVRVGIFEADARFRGGGFDLRAEYAHVFIVNSYKHQRLPWPDSARRPSRRAGGASTSRQATTCSASCAAGRAAGAVAFARYENVNARSRMSPYNFNPPADHRHRGSREPERAVGAEVVRARRPGYYRPRPQVALKVDVQIALGAEGPPAATPGAARRRARDAVSRSGAAGRGRASGTSRLGLARGFVVLMRQFASSGFRLWNLGREARSSTRAFCVLIFLGIVSSVLYYEDLVGPGVGTSGITRYYAGAGEPPPAPPGNGGTGSGSAAAAPGPRTSVRPSTSRTTTPSPATDRGGRHLPEAAGGDALPPLHAAGGAASSSLTCSWPRPLRPREADLDSGGVGERGLPPGHPLAGPLRERQAWPSCRAVGLRPHHTCRC